MPKSRRPAIAVIGNGVTRLNVVVADMDNEEQALAFAKKAAEETGRTVTVRDEAGRILGTYHGTAHRRN